MKVRYTDLPGVKGSADRFNMSGHDEVIVGFDDQDMASMPIKLLDIQLASGAWVLMSKAFRDKLIMGDTYDRRFAEATDEDRERGWIR